MLMVDMKLNVTSYLRDFGLAMYNSVLQNKVFGQIKGSCFEDRFLERTIYEL